MLKPGGARRKGNRGERRVAAMFRDLCDPHASRVPGSGAFAGLPGDVLARVTPDRKWQIEVKTRKAAPKTFVRQLGTSDMLAYLIDGAGGRPPDLFVIMPQRSFAELVRAAHLNAETAAEQLPLAPGAKG